MNKSTQTQTKSPFQVDIFKNGKLVDTQAVSARDKGHAETMAMIQTNVHFSGELVTYTVLAK